jgi:hypothetical protein
MLSHHFPTFRKLASAMAMAGCLAFSGGAAATDPAAVRVAEFQLLHGVRQWPRLQGCGYDRAWIGVTGTVLTVRTWLEGGEQRASGETALQRDSTCHVPIRHRIESWPADLGPGTYVVAATVYDASQHPGEAVAHPAGGGRPRRLAGNGGSHGPLYRRSRATAGVRQGAKMSMILRRWPGTDELRAARKSMVGCPLAVRGYNHRLCWQTLPA